MEPSDEELVARCQAGDDRAMDLLVGRYHARLYRFAYRMLQDREAAQDVTQETLLRAYRGAARFDTEKRCSTWLLAIAANLCRTELRRRSRNVVYGLDALAECAAPDSVEGTVLERLAGEEVYRALARLSPEHRLALLLFYYERLTYPEIAAVCGCAVGTVKSRVHYALVRLRRLLLPAITGLEPETCGKGRSPC